MSLPATRRALMNSLPWIGKIAGCFLSDLFIDKGGYKNTMYAAAGIQIVGVIRKLDPLTSAFASGPIDLP